MESNIGETEWSQGINPYQGNVPFLYPWKHQKPGGWLIFSESIQGAH